MGIRKINITVGNVTRTEAVMKSYPFHDGKTYLMPMYGLTVVGSDEKGNPERQEFDVLRFGVLKQTADSPASVVGLAAGQTHVIKAWLPKYNVHSATSDEIGAWQVYDSFLIHDGPDYPEAEKFGSIGCVEICRSGGFITFCDFIDSVSGADAKDRDDRLAQVAKSGMMSVTYQAAPRPPLKHR